MEPDTPVLTSSNLLIGSYGVLVLVGVIGLGFALSEMAGGSDGSGALLLVILFVSLPYGLAAWASWLARQSRDAVLGLLGLWIVGGVASVWSLADAIWLHPKFLSGLTVVVLPVIQIPIVVVAGLLAWLVARNAGRRLPDTALPQDP